MLRWDFLCWVCWIDVDTTPWKSIPNSLKTLLDTIYILSKIHTLNTKISTLRVKDILYWFGLETVLKWLVWKLHSKWFGLETLFLSWFGLETLFWNGLVWKLCFEMVWFGTGAWRMQEWNLSLQRRMEWQVGRFNSLWDYWQNS